MTSLYTKEYLDERCADCREKARAEQYRRQLGGQTAAHSKRKKEIERLKLTIHDLDAENDELRKLVSHMYKTLRLSAELPATVGSLETTERMMRELGIEVES